MARIDDSTTWTAGKVRDVRNTFQMLNAVETPFMSMLKKSTKPSASLLETPFRSRPTPAAGAVEDGNDVSSADFKNYEANKGLLYSRLQRFWAPVSVGEIAELTTKQHGGIQSVMKDNIEQAIMAVKTGMEQCFLSFQESAASETSGKTTWKLRGAAVWTGLAGYGSLDAQAPIASAARIGSGQSVTNRATASAVLESDIRGVINSIRKNTKRPAGTLSGFCTTDMREQFCMFTMDAAKQGVTTATRQWNGTMGAKEIGVDVEIYRMAGSKLVLHEADLLPVEGETPDGGTIATHSVFMYLFDMEHWDMPVVRYPRVQTLENQGGGPRAIVDAISYLVCDNPTRHGVIAYNAP